jgi:hypothetical protein
MVQIKEVDWLAPSNDLSEIYQEVTIKFAFAFVSDTGIVTQSHPWAQCRDFLHDAIAGELHGYNVNIWGFTFNRETNPKRNRVCTDKTMLMISRKGIKTPNSFRNKLGRSLLYINHYEDMLGLPNSKITKLPKNTVDDGYKHVWLIEGPKFWISAPYLISLLTLLLRIGEKLPPGKLISEPAAVFKKIAFDKKYPEHTGDNDVKYLRQCHDKIDTVVRLSGKIEEMVGTDNGFLKLYEWQSGKFSTGQSMFHDKSGILSICTTQYYVSEINDMLTKKFKG